MSQHCRQILVSRTSQRRLPPTFSGHSLKILFDHSWDVSIWHLRHVSIWRPGEVLKRRPRNVLIWRSRNVPGRLIRGEPRTFSRRPPRGPSKHSNLDVPRFLLTFLSELIRLTKLSKSISTLKVYWEPSQTSKTEHFLWN